MKKTWNVEEYELTMEEMAECITREYAGTVMDDAEFREFCEKQDAFLQRKREEADEYASTHYFPGCYGDPLTDC